MGMKLKNILTLDKLVYSDEIEPKHKKHINNMGQRFADFNIQNFMTTPQPKNSSNQTFSELRNLERITPDVDVKAADKVEKYFEDGLKALGLKYPKKKVKELLDDTRGVIFKLKYHYNRPRPQQVAKALGLKFHEQPLETSKTPSYPSGHSIQGRFISRCLSKLYPEHESDIMKIGDEISRSRLIAKVHFPSDSEFGLAIGDELFKKTEYSSQPVLEANPNSKKVMKHKRKNLAKNATKDHERTTFMMGIGSKAKTDRKKEIERGKKYPAKDAPKKAYDPKSFRSDFVKGKKGKLKRRKTKPSQFNKKFDKMYGKKEEIIGMKLANLLEKKEKKQSFSDKFDKMYGEGSWKTVKEVWKMGSNNLVEKAGIDKALQNKAKLSGMPKGILKQVYDRGLAAWKVGHKPGAPQHAWAMARVNSFATKSPGTWGKADKDLAKKVGGK